MSKVSHSKWFPTIGNIVWSHGKHSWKLHVDKYEKSDFSGLLIGVADPEVFPAIMNEADSYHILSSKGVFGIGGTGYTYNFNSASSGTFRTKVGDTI